MTHKETSAENLIEILESKGLHDEAVQLRETQKELNALVRPPGLVSELTDNLKERARRQWELIVGEVQETAELVELVNRRVLNGEKLTHQERKQAQEQILDIMKMVPAGMIATASALSPLPMTLAFTPMVLRKLGLLPSRWREAHVLQTLKDQSSRLHELGADEQARELDGLAAEVKAQAQARDVTGSTARLLSYWTSAPDGLRAQDRYAYDFTVENMRTLRTSEAGRRVWYFQIDDEIFGPLPLQEVEKHQSDNDSILVCHERMLKWVKLVDIA